MLQEGALKHFLDLGVSFPRDRYALTQLAQEGDGRLGAGYQCSLLFWTQVVVI